MSGKKHKKPVIVVNFGGEWGAKRKKTFFKKDFIYLFIFFLERGREGEREGEKHQCVVASRGPPTGYLACNAGMCPDWESNQRPFGLQPVLNPLSYTSQGKKEHFYFLAYSSVWFLIFLFLNFYCEHLQPSKRL